MGQINQVDTYNIILQFTIHKIVGRSNTLRYQLTNNWKASKVE